MKANTKAHDWVILAGFTALVLLGANACTELSVNVGQPSGTLQPVSRRFDRPASGPFVSVETSTPLSGITSICGTKVSGTYMRFYPPVQTPDAGDTVFQGYLWRNTSPAGYISNQDYVLQWFVSSQNTACCTPLGANDVTCPVVPGLPYRFIAHFKEGKAPAAGTSITLMGAW